MGVFESALRNSGKVMKAGVLPKEIGIKMRPLCPGAPLSLTTTVVRSAHMELDTGWGHVCILVVPRAGGACGPAGGILSDASPAVYGFLVESTAQYEPCSFNTLQELYLVSQTLPNPQS